MGRGYEDNKSSTDHTGFSGIAQSSVSTSPESLCELLEVWCRRNNPVICGRTLRRARIVHGMTVIITSAEFEHTHPQHLRTEFSSKYTQLWPFFKRPNEHRKLRCGVPKALAPKSSPRPLHKACQSVSSPVTIRSRWDWPTCPSNKMD